MQYKFMILGKNDSFPKCYPHHSHQNASLPGLSVQVIFVVFIKSSVLPLAPSKFSLLAKKYKMNFLDSFQEFKSSMSFIL